MASENREYYDMVDQPHYGYPMFSFVASFGKSIKNKRASLSFMKLSAVRLQVEMLTSMSNVVAYERNFYDVYHHDRIKKVILKRMNITKRKYV